MLRGTLYQSLKWFGLEVQDKGPRQVIPQSNNNYALYYYRPPGRLAPLMSAKETRVIKFDLNSLYSACMWDTRGSSGENNYTNSSSSAAGDSPTNPTGYFPAVECDWTMTCRDDENNRVGPFFSHFYPQKIESNIMLRSVFPQRSGRGYQPRWDFRSLMSCFVSVTSSPVGVEKVILALDQISYIVQIGQDIVNVD